MPPSPLNLVPNEVVGYRVLVDSHNWNVALVKRHGAASKFAGQEYAQIQSHHKNLEHALLNIQERVLKDELLQNEQQKIVHELQTIVQAHLVAKKAVADALHNVLTQLGLDAQKLTNAMARFEDYIPEEKPE